MRASHSSLEAVKLSSLRQPSPLHTVRTCASHDCCYVAARPANATRADWEHCTSTDKCYWDSASLLAKRSLSRQMGECRHRPYDLTASVAWNQGRGIPSGRCDEVRSVAEWRVCWPPVRRALMAGSCLVYSFGIFESDAFTSFMASSGCRVYAFDPGRSPRAVPPNVSFHRWGLRTDARLSLREEQAFTSVTYGRADGDYLRLDEIRTRLGHERTQLTLLKLDCEGCEWLTLAELDLSAVDQIVAELHFSSSLRFSERVAGEVVPRFDANVRQQGMAAFHFRHQPGATQDQHVAPSLVRAGMRHASCCREVSLMRAGGR